MQSIASAAASINRMAAAPFRTQLPLGKVALLFVFFVILAFQWRLILDRIDFTEDMLP